MSQQSNWQTKYWSKYEQNKTSHNDLIEKQYNALPLFLAAQRELPNNWRQELSEWKCKFIDSIINLDIKSQRIKLPHIFLARSVEC